MKEVLSGKHLASLSSEQIDRLRNEFEGFVDKEGIEVLDADDLSSSLGRSEIFGWSSPVVEKTSTVESRDGRWRGINGADALHVVLAHRAGAEFYATFDEGFKAINDLAALGWALKPLIVSEVYQLD